MAASPARRLSTLSTATSLMIALLTPAKKLGAMMPVNP
jgi:hypothetical protein